MSYYWSEQVEKLSEGIIFKKFKFIAILFLLNIYKTNTLNYQILELINDPLAIVKDVST